MTIEYTSRQLVTAALKAAHAGNERAAEGILTLLAIHYPHEAEVLQFAVELQLMDDPEAGEGK